MKLRSSHLLDRPRPRLPALLYAAATLSGAASLAHEVAWSRLFTLTAGSSADAAAVILMGFMSGFGIGALLAAALERRLSRPIHLFIASQLFIALYGLAIFALATDFFPRLWSYLLVGQPHAVTWLVRILFSLFQVTLPAAAMGMSLPLLVNALAPPGSGRDLDAAESRLRRSSAALIALNTAGACAGTLAAGYFLVPALGIRTSCIAAALVNLAAAAAAAPLAAAGRYRGRREAPADARAAGPSMPMLLGALAAGFFVLSMEIVWRRVLVMAFGHDTYGMTAMLAVVISGLSAGGALGYLLLRLAPDRARDAGGVLLLLAGMVTLPATALGIKLVTGASPDPLGVIGIPSFSTSLYGGIVHQLLVSAVVIGIPSVLAGGVLPVLCGELRHGEGSASLSLARLLGAHYAGSILGAAAAAFLLVGMLGIQCAAASLCLIAAAAGAGLLLSGGGGRRRGAAAAGAVAVAASLLLVPGGLPRKLFLRTSGGGHLEILYYKEGRTSTVGVTKNRIDGQRQLLINGVNEVSSRFVHDQSFALLGHLGLLLHPDPQKVLLVSFGGGITAGAVASHAPKELTAVDLEKGVVEAAKWFGDLNGGVLDDAALKIVIEDGRFHLLTTPERYDVIVIDSTHPRSVDSWLLYTKRFYELARNRLSTGGGGCGGIVVQWVPLHGMSTSEFKIITATFLTAFPDAQLWANAGYECRGFSGYALLVGSASGPIAADMELMRRKMEARTAVRESLSPWLLDSPEAVMDCFIASARTLKDWTEGLPVIEDDAPIIPFVSTWSRTGRVHPSILTRILHERDLPVTNPPDAFLEDLPLRYLALGHLLRGDLGGALEKRPGSALLARYAVEKQRAASYYRRLAAAAVLEAGVLAGAVRNLRGLGEIDAALAAARRAAVLHPLEEQVLFELALCLESAGKDGKASSIYGRILDLEPDAVPAINNLALLLAEKHLFKESLLLLRRSRDIDPAHYPTWIATGKVQMMRKDFDAALDALRRAASMAPGDPLIRNYMGLASLEAGYHAEALKHFEGAAALDPFWEEPYFNAGTSLLSLEKHAEAAAWFERAVLLDPADSEALLKMGMALAGRSSWEKAIDALLCSLQLDSSSDLAWLHLGLAYKNLGNHEEARQCFENALRINPELAGIILRQGGDAGKPDK